MAAALLAGCGSMPLRLAYNNGPRLLYWWLDAYVDISDAQSPPVRAAIAGYFRWHRATHLPQYAQLVAQVRGRLEEEATPQALCTLWQDVRAHGDAALGHAVPAIADFLRTLTPEQVRHVERRFERVNREFREEHLDPEPAKRQREAVKRARDRAEMLYGPLEAPQRELLARAAAASPFDPHRWNDERLHRQQDILRTLRGVLDEPDAPAAAVQSRVAGLAKRLQVSPREDYRDYHERLTAHHCRTAAALHNSTTPAQRQHARQRLHLWEEDLRELAGTAAGM